MSYLQTAYWDLLGLIKLVQIKNNYKYHSVPVHSVSRDICVVLYEINKNIFGNKFELSEDIKAIRHRVKLDNKNKNKEIFEDVFNYHLAKFGDDIDNIGFYLEDKKLVGSTVFVTYVYCKTSFFKASLLEESIYKFSLEVGEKMVVFLKGITELSNGELEFSIPTPLESRDDEEYEFKDVWHTNIYTDEIKINTLITRMLLIQNDLSTCIWLERVLNYKQQGLTIDKYILLRLITIKIDEVMDCLFNIDKYLPIEFNQIAKMGLSEIMSEYKEDIKEECTNLRNMLHYSKDEMNFYKYITEKNVIDNDYIEKLIKKIIFNYVLPLNDIISIYFNIDSLTSMSDWEKIYRRTKAIEEEKSILSSLSNESLNILNKEGNSVRRNAAKRLLDERLLLP